MKRIVIQILIVAALIVTGFCFGVLIGDRDSFVYQHLKKVYRTFLASRMLTPIPREYLEIDPQYLKTDVEALISIHDPSDISRLRLALNTFIFGEPELSRTILPAQIQRGFTDARFKELYEARVLARIDSLVVEMEYGLQSNIYHFVPAKPNGSLIILHQGHNEDFGKDIRFIGMLLENGYAVAGFSMPLMGLNNRPTVHIRRIGYLHVSNHDQLKFLTPSKGHPVQYFIQPVIAFLNYVGKEYRYRHIGMCGVSGGGWTTTLLAALDPRIETSFPIAGSYPIFLRSDASVSDWGDWEQTIPELYTIANYLELYVLGAYGENRYQCQILNQFDECCFNGVKWKTYKDTVVRRVQGLRQGRWAFLLEDSSREHAISDRMQREIIRLLKKHWSEA